MAKVLLESTREPGKTKLFTRRDAKVLMRLGRWKLATTGQPAAVKPAKPARLAPAHAKLDALIAKHGELSAATVAELEDAADAYGMQESDIEGSGANDRVLKADWLRALEQLRKGPGRYVRTDMQAGQDYNTRHMTAQ